jgi:hypothetical protein
MKRIKTQGVRPQYLQDVSVDPIQFLEDLRKQEISSHYDDITADGWVYYEESWGDYHKLFKATDRQIAIHDAVGGLLAALRIMEGE